MALLETTKLYDFQEAGVKFFADQKQWKTPASNGGLCADERGLGKTIQAIAHAELMGLSPVLIICSKKLRPYWRNEILKFTNRRLDQIQILDGNTIESGKIYVLIHWDQLRRYNQLLLKVPWQLVIIDEAHKGKNRKAQRTQAMLSLSKIPNKDELTGNPIVNQPADLWSLLKFLDPKEYTSYWRFFDDHVLSVDNPFGGKHIIGVRNPDALVKEISRYAFRRTKKGVKLELPEKIYTTIPVELLPSQRRAYEQMKKDMIAQLSDELVVMSPTVLSQITRLRQIAIGLGTLDPDSHESAKCDAVMDIIDDKQGKVVVASQFKWTVYELARRLTQAGISWTTMTGDDDDEVMFENYTKFQEQNDPQIMLMTIQTGGEGWTLTRADTLVFTDLPWTPKDKEQTEDRVHRIDPLGRDRKTVEIIVLHAENTVEDRVEKAIDFKGGMFDVTFGRLKELL